MTTIAIVSSLAAVVILFALWRKGDVRVRVKIGHGGMLLDAKERTPSRLDRTPAARAETSNVTTIADTTPPRT